MASYPTSVKSFTSKSNGDAIQATHVTDLQDEVTAVETDLVNGFSRTIIPNADNTYNFGSSAKQWAIGFFKKLALAGVTYTFPSADGTNGQTLVTNGSAVLSWGTPATGYPADGRLTLTSGTPVTTTDVTGAGTIYYTPFRGNRIATYSGSAWSVSTFTELSLALTLTSGKPYDVFVYDNSGTPALEVLVWTNDTTRATALTTQDGVLVKSGATTRRYVGTIYASGLNTTEDSFAKRYVWNYYNRVKRPMRVLEATNSWTYSTNSFRQANNAAANQLDFVYGFVEDSVSAFVVANASGSAGGTQAWSSIGYDSTTVADAGTLSNAQYPQNAGFPMPVNAELTKLPAVGRHTLVWLEKGNAATVTWYGDNGSDGTQSGIHGFING